MTLRQPLCYIAELEGRGIGGGYRTRWNAESSRRGGWEVGVGEIHWSIYVGYIALLMLPPPFAPRQTSSLVPCFDSSIPPAHDDDTRTPPASPPDSSTGLGPCPPWADARSNSVTPSLPAPYDATLPPHRTRRQGRDPVLHGLTRGWTRDGGRTPILHGRAREGSASLVRIRWFFQSLSWYQ